MANAAALLQAEGCTVSGWDQRLQAGSQLPADRIDGLVLVTAIADRAQCYPLDLTPIRSHQPWRFETMLRPAERRLGELFDRAAPTYGQVGIGLLRQAGRRLV
ncbi:hypothetical protein [Kitasatospora sp. GAS204B]|uniref:hypothetical protein n=1 Tax=unclassified Kitasatospora TaxID=2633591 RepID=UPI00247632A6|nr:hypothetical protein [Kitasatospora sp. GAS204B]MDH6119851.1 hypothetical protein [Kitasatospora sp. GAS204B]